jgi:sugar phosphate isomerase/epimerase
MFLLGVDSYSYHRLLGDVRPGETVAREVLPDGHAAVVREAERCGAEFVSLETMFLDGPRGVNARAVRAVARGVEVGLSWGGADGFAFGSNPRAIEDLETWLRVAASLGASLVRVVAGGPALRGRLDRERLRATGRALAAAADRAGERGIDLALENHGDLTCEELLAVLDEAGRDNLGVCFDSANAIRVGDDPALMLERVLPALRMVHLKDCAAEWDDPVAGPVSVEYGRGAVPVAAIVDALSEGGFAGPVCVELGQLSPDADERHLVEEGLTWLRARRTAAASRGADAR